MTWWVANACFITVAHLQHDTNWLHLKACQDGKPVQRTPKRMRTLQRDSRLQKRSGESGVLRGVQGLRFYLEFPLKTVSVFFSEHHLQSFPTCILTWAAVFHSLIITCSDTPVSSTAPFPVRLASHRPHLWPTFHRWAAAETRIWSALCILISLMHFNCPTVSILGLCGVKQKQVAKAIKKAQAMGEFCIEIILYWLRFLVCNFSSIISEY